MIKEITNASNIMYGNRQVKEVYYGSTKLWEQNPPSKTFNLQPIVLDSDRNVVLSYKSQMPTQGNSTFIMKCPGVDISKVDISYPYESFNSNVIPKVVVNKIDDWALYCNRYGSFDTWPGGSSGGLYDENDTFIYKDQNGEQRKSIKFYGHGDEDNQMFLEGLYVNKVIKVAAKGRTDSLKIKFYPYSFDDEFYNMKSFEMYLVDYEDTSNNGKNLYKWDNDNRVFRHTSNGSIKTIEDTIFSSFDVTYYALTGTINYTIKPNLTNDFKDIMLSFRDCAVHFIQEPHNDHRVYIVNWKTRAFNFSNGDSYLNNGDTSENMFHLGGSKIINHNMTLNFPVWSDVMIPDSLNEVYDIEFNGTIKTDDAVYEWDNMTFKHYNCYKDSKIIFNKK